MTADPRIPKFETEEEEAKWWFDHREETAVWTEKAAAEGRTTGLTEILGRRQPGGSTPTVI
jgi:hypothetical protein